MAETRYTMIADVPWMMEQFDTERNKEYDPSKIAMSSKEPKLYWKYPYDDPITGRHFDFVWQAAPADRLYAKSPCPFLARGGTWCWPGFNDLLTRRPDVAAFWSDKNGFGPDTVTETSGRIVIWRYDYTDPKTGETFPFEWKERIADMTGRSMCPYLLKRKPWIWPTFNSLKAKFPEIAEEFDLVRNEDDPAKINPKSEKSYWWTCKEGHHYRTSVDKRTARGHGCPYCSGRRTEYKMANIRIKPKEIDQELLLPEVKAFPLLLSEYGELILQCDQEYKDLKKAKDKRVTGGKDTWASKRLGIARSQVKRVRMLVTSFPASLVVLCDTSAIPYTALLSAHDFSTDEFKELERAIDDYTWEHPLKPVPGDALLRMINEIKSNRENNTERNNTKAIDIDLENRIGSILEVLNDGHFNIESQQVIEESITGLEKALALLKEKENDIGIYK